MATRILSQQPTSQSAARGDARGGPASIAAARISRASLVLGGLGLASAILVSARLLATWRISSRAVHQVSIFGQKLSYPAANVGAILVLILAALGAAVTVRAITGALRELRASRRFHRLIAGQGLQPLHGALQIADAQPRAFCAGLLRPRVYVSTGAVAILDDVALRAVLAHEEHHASRRDPLRLAAGRVLANALFYLPGLDQLVERHQALAELSADESAVSAAPANRSALARAMLSFSENPGASPGGVDPARVDYLLGDSPSWRFPALLCVALAGVIGVGATAALLIGHVASGSATLGLPFLSRQPCVVLLAAIPSVLGIFALMSRRRFTTR